MNINKPMMDSLQWVICYTHDPQKRVNNRLTGRPLWWKHHDRKSMRMLSLSHRVILYLLQKNDYLCIIWKPFWSRTAIHTDMPMVSLFGMKQLCIFLVSMTFNESHLFTKRIWIFTSNKFSPDWLQCYTSWPKGNWPKVSRVFLCNNPELTYKLWGWHLAPGQGAARGTQHFRGAGGNED